MPLSREEIEEIKSILSREPTLEELAMFEAQWSEHCSYKSSRRLLRLLPTAGRNVLIGPGRDAPAVEVFPGVAVVFKIESHNHPSAVDPYNGAATGIGGIVRDILTLGAKPIALLDMLYLGDLRDSRAKWLAKGIVKGISDYGNRIGIPTVAGDTWFDSSFNTQPLVNVACVGIAKTEELVRDRPAPRDAILVIGNPTGRDGLLGSSFASKPLSDNPSEDIGAVQVADPLMEKILIDSILELARKKLVKFVKDLGGGGLTTAVAEVAADFDLGAELRLDRLHLRTELTPLEILVSESQERMMLVVDKEKLADVVAVLEKYDVPRSLIGFFDGSGRIKAYYENKLVADIPAKELAKPRDIWRLSRPPVELVKLLNPVSDIPVVSVAEALDSLLSSPNIASKKWIYEQYDHEVGIRTILKPGFGDAAVLRLDTGDRRGIAVKGDANPRYTAIDPFNGAANSVAECYRNLVAVGSTPVAFVDEPNAGNPEKLEHFWYFEMMVKGIAWMTNELGIPVVGGKVSFYNEDYRGRQVKPTATIVGVGAIEDVGRVKSIDLKHEGSTILVVGTTYPELGGTEYLARVHGIEAGGVPTPRPSSELRNASYIAKLIDDEIALSVHDIGLGGLAVAIAEMAVLSDIGVEIDIEKIPHRGCSRLDEILFSETQARYFIEVKPERVEKALELASALGTTAAVVAKTTGRKFYTVKLGSITVIEKHLDYLRELHEESLRKTMV
ncbi:MAG: phosphoribosylformylglycinamidine synthase subunit PurL [Sulfolobales archaeon]|nr:phosphoribosylformylglycinamidine synthase subunit PurL [Sulfolobales archaeon]MDW8082881.1 phosphoribosylformylglycinamidine synthase subunit PurL [Sulfolobales archaeon]